MTQKVKILIGAALFALLIALAAFAYNILRENAAPDTLPSDPERIKAPDFTVETGDGGSLQLSDWEGKPVVLNFWASWCPPCKAEMPDFEVVYAELGSEVVFMMVNLTDGQRETKETATDYVSAQGFTFPVYYDTQQEAAYVYGIRSIPTTVFIDSDGYIVTGAEGQLDEEMLRYGISLLHPDSVSSNAMSSNTVSPNSVSSNTVSSNTMSSNALSSDLALSGSAPSIDHKGDIMNITYQKISAEDAYGMMQETTPYILLDVRTEVEYQAAHIPGAIVIPDTEIEVRAATDLPDKDALILLYCRTGRRSEIAARALIDAGYTMVYDFGGIIDWPYELE